MKRELNFDWELGGRFGNSSGAGLESDLDSTGRAGCGSCPQKTFPHKQTYRNRLEI